MRKQILPAAFILGCASATTSMAADIGANTTIGGVSYFDLSHISLQNEDKTGAKFDAPPTGTGFDIKRLYLVVNHKFDDVWSANLTTDAQFSTASTTTVVTPPTAPGGNPGTASVLSNQNSSGGVTEVFIKKLYLQGAFDKGFVLRLGAADTPWIPYVENVLYGYRWVEKVVADRLGFGTSADWGVNASGTLGDGGMFGYSASVLNGGGYKNPSRTKDVDFEARVNVQPTEWLILAGGFYSGHLGQITATNQNFPSNTATRADAALVVHTAGLRVGAEYINAKNYKTVNNLATSAFGTSAIVTSSGATPVSDRADGFSGWVSYDLTPDWSVFGRYDDIKLSKDVAPNLKDKYFNVGVAYKPTKALDFALVYKNEKVQNGSAVISGANANASYAIGGANAAGEGKFDEVGIYAQWRF